MTMVDPHIVGIDYSMSSPGMCIFTPMTPEFRFRNCKFYYVTEVQKQARVYANIQGTKIQKPDAFECREARFSFLAEWVLKNLHPLMRVRVGIEDYAYSSKGRSLFQIGENVGLLRYRLWSNKYTFDTFEPTTVKKWGAGSGSAKKVDMLNAFKRKDPEGYEIMSSAFNIKVDKKGWVNSPVSDLIDSYFICELTYLRYKNVQTS